MALLECPVCFQQLDVSAKVLPCQHTFCLSCLQKHQAALAPAPLLCPDCRAPVPARTVEELPANLLLVRLLEGLQGSPRPSRDRQRTRYSVPSSRADVTAREGQHQGEVSPGPGHLYKWIDSIFMSLIMTDGHTAGKLSLLLMIYTPMKMHLHHMDAYSIKIILYCYIKQSILLIYNTIPEGDTRDHSTSVYKSKSRGVSVSNFFHADFILAFEVMRQTFALHHHVDYILKKKTVANIYYV